MNDVVEEMVTPQVVHQGRNRTCCRGKCFLNTEPERVFLTILMINVPVIGAIALTFNEIFIESFQDWEAAVWQSLTLILIYLTAGANFNMMACSMTDIKKL